MILADAQPNPNALSEAWLIAVSVGSFLAAIAGIVTSIIIVSSNKKQKREVFFGVEPVSKGEFEKHVATNEVDHRDLVVQITEVKRDANINQLAANKEAHESRERLQQTMNVVLQAVARIEGKIEGSQSQPFPP